MIHHWLKPALQRTYRAYQNRGLANAYASDFGRRALISYITEPFRRQDQTHTNSLEARSAARILHELGYRVDVMHYEGKQPRLDPYELIYGFGDVFERYFESGLNGKKTIYYGTGMHVCHQNTATLLRIKEVHAKKGVWLTRSGRFVEKTWSHQTTLVDGIIAVGDDMCAATYARYYGGKIVSVRPPFYQTLDPNAVLAARAVDARTHFLWFGGAGLIHKGLDLCLEYFAGRPDLTLHVCGDLDREKEFVRAYHRELFCTPNIVCHGFVHVASEAFRRVLQSCAFTVFPSCSEGGSASVLTAVGNGAVVPLITPEASAATGYEIRIATPSLAALGVAVESACALSDSELLDLQFANSRQVLAVNSPDCYYESLKEAISSLADS